MKRKKKHEHINHERWLISYADLVTLLFAFFVVMYAVGHSDSVAVHQLEQSIMAAFSELGLFTPASLEAHLKPEMSVGYQARADMDDQVALSNLRQTMQTELAPEIHNHAVSLDLTRQGLVIRLEELGFFDSGSDQMRPEAAPVLEEIANALRPLPNQIRVEGHTDNVPIHTAQFSSNWQLSTSRASAIVSVLIDQFHLDPERMSAAGYAEFHPIADNTTDAGRRQNRRVDVVVVAQAMTHAGSTSEAVSPAALAPPPLPGAATGAFTPLPVTARPLLPPVAFPGSGPPASLPPSR